MTNMNEMPRHIKLNNMYY